MKKQSIWCRNLNFCHSTHFQTRWKISCPELSPPFERQCYSAMQPTSGWTPKQEMSRGRSTDGINFNITVKWFSVHFYSQQTAINGKFLGKGFIIDTRTVPTIQNARAKGGGQELEVNYPGWKKINRGIDRYHFFLDSYSKLMEAVTDTGCSHDKWMSRLTVSSWLTHVKDILTCGCLVAQCLERVRIFYVRWISFQKVNMNVTSTTDWY